MRRRTRTCLRVAGFSILMGDAVASLAQAAFAAWKGGPAWWIAVYWNTIGEGPLEMALLAVGIVAGALTMAPWKY